MLRNVLKLWNATNKLFKSDSQRVAFLLCVVLVFMVACGGIGIALLTP
ncbi:DUF3265 domain-containing protein [Vibrio mimicus]|nr:DUF3265 domain-containing protein [Vibrio mimicus]